MSKCFHSRPCISSVILESHIPVKKICVLTRRSQEANGSISLPPWRQWIFFPWPARQNQKCQTIHQPHLEARTRHTFLAENQECHRSHLHFSAFLLLLPRVFCTRQNFKAFRQYPTFCSEHLSFTTTKNEMKLARHFLRLFLALEACWSKSMLIIICTISAWFFD